MSAGAPPDEPPPMPDESPPTAARRLRVLHVIDSLAVGGAEQLVVRLAEASHGDRLDVTVATLRENPASPLEAALRATGAALVTFPMTGPGLRLRPRPLASLLRFARRGRFDVLHTHLNSSHVVGAVAGALAGIPVVATLHNIARDAGDRRRGTLRNLVLRRLATELIAVGDTVAETQRAALGARALSVVPNPAPDHVPRHDRASVRDGLGLGPDVPVALAVGRLEPQKNHALAIEAWADVTRARPGAVLLIAGEGRRRHELEALVDRQGLTGAVRLLGWRTDVADLLGAADLVISSSAWEGMPLGLLEAMAAGRAVVATDVGDCRSVVGDAGRIVAADTDALARGILELLCDDGARRSAEAEAVRRARQEFGTEQWVSSICDVYERAAARARRRPA